MRAKLCSLLFVAALLGACAPYRMENEHLLLNEMPGLTVLERSIPPDPPDEHVKRARYDLPVLSTLKRDVYTLTIRTPANHPGAMLFIGARNAAGEPLRLEGKYLRSVHPNALVTNADHPFTFMTEDADGEPLEFVVRDADGKRLGVERLAYRIVTSGVIWGVEWI